MSASVSQPPFGNVVIPGGYTALQLAPQVPGATLANAIGIIGESVQGPATTAAALASNAYAPSQLAQVIQTYGSGPIVDAFRALCASSNDPNITGAPNLIYIAKTNASSSASVAINEAGFSTYGTIAAQAPGSGGNLFNTQILASTAAVQPTTGIFSYMPSGATINAVFRLQGAAAISVSVGTNLSPASLSATLYAVDPKLLVTGGVNRSFVSGNAGVSLTVALLSGDNAQINLNSGVTFTVAPVVGDTLIIPPTGSYGSTANSVFAGAASANYGAYVVTSVINTTTSASILATKLTNTSTTTVIVPPVNVSTTISATPNNDIQVYTPINLVYKAGVNRSSFAAAASTNASVSVVGSALRVNFLGTGFNFTTTGSAPQVGDDLYIWPGSAIAGAANANLGWYTISSVYSAPTASYLIASPLAGQTPVNVASTSLSGTPDASDIKCQRPWLTGSAAELSLSDGGQALSVANILFNFATTTSASFISSAAAPTLLKGTEYSAEVLTTKPSASFSETLSGIGGTSVLQIGYFGTTATIGVSNSAITVTVSGGPGASFSAATSQFNTVGDFVTYVNTLPGFAASASNASQALPFNYSASVNGTTTSLCLFDAGTYGICSSVTATEYPGQLKADFSAWLTALGNSVAIAYAQPSVATAGIPDPQSAKYLSGGSVGATTGAAVNAAIDAFQNVAVNYIVPLFSQNATLDAQQGVTAIGSTYQISAINAYLKSHCLAMSQPLAKKNRSGFVSIRDVFTNCIAQAQSLASARMALTFQDIKGVNSLGQLAQFQPWMGAVIAAGMSLAGEDEPITNKQPNLSGIVSYYGDFNPQNTGQVTQALQAGLLILQPQPSGTIVWVADQTTYSATNQLIPNSVAATLLGDLVAVDLANSATQYITGRPTSVMTPSKVTSYIQNKMTQYFNNAWITASQGAPAGYNSLQVGLSNGAYSYSVNIFINSEILYILGTVSLSTPSFAPTAS